MAVVVLVVGGTCHGVVYRFTIALAQQVAAVWAGVVDDGLVLLCAPHGVFLPCAQGEEVVYGGNAVCVGFVPEFIHMRLLFVAAMEQSLQDTVVGMAIAVQQ